MPKMSKVQWGRDENIDIVMGISVAQDQPPLLYSENQYEPQQQHSCLLRSLALSRISNACIPEISELSYKNIL